MAVGAHQEREDRPAYVRFKKVTVQDGPASLTAGHYVGKDIDFVMITPPYSRDIVELKVSQWKMNMEQDVRNGRLPDEWHKNYLRAYDAWCAGQEIPVVGTAIRAWGVISPAMQETLIRMNILTVEDLAAVNDEGLRRIGMGAMELKSKAVAWLAQLKDKGPLTIKMAALETENLNLKVSLEAMQAQIEALISQQIRTAQESDVPRESITADDIMPEPEPKTLTLKKK